MDSNFWSTCHVSGVAQQMTVCISGTQSELPLRNTKALCQNFAVDSGVFGREHESEAPGRLLLNGANCRIGCVAAHRAGVTEAKVRVLHAV